MKISKELNCSILWWGFWKADKVILRWCSWQQIKYLYVRLQHLWNVSLPLWNFTQRLTRGVAKSGASSSESLCKWGKDKGRTPKAAYRARTGQEWVWGVGPIIPHFNGYFIAGEELKNDGRTFHTIFQASHIIHPQKDESGGSFWVWPWATRMHNSVCLAPVYSCVATDVLYLHQSLFPCLTPWNEIYEFSLDILFKWWMKRVRVVRRKRKAFQLLTTFAFWQSDIWMQVYIKQTRKRHQFFRKSIL